jgi:predicted restriction endonuclease
LRFGRDSRPGHFRVNSGGELQVGAEIAEQIKSYAQSNPAAESVAFSMEVPSSAVSDIDQAKVKGEFKDVPETERDAIIAARLGQGSFRADLMRAYKRKCAVTGTDVPELLRASHIKPWRDSNNAERLCVHNGLLLVANLDAAFDAKLISFSDAGRMLFHKRLGSRPYSMLGIKEGSNLTRPPSQMQRKYLTHHRKATGLKQ